MIRTIGKKGKKAYYISKDLSSLLLEYAIKRREIDANTKAFFISQKDHKFASAGINQFLERVCQKINLEKHITPQTFRRTLNTLRYKMGCSKEDRKILLNHKIQDVNFEHYVKLNYNEYLQKYDMWNPFAKLEI